MKGKWRITEMPDYDAGFADMMEPAFIVFDGEGGGAFGCVTGAIHGAGSGRSVEFSWAGSDEMDDAAGNGYADINPDNTLSGEIQFQNGDKTSFTAIPWTSSTAC